MTPAAGVRIRRINATGSWKAVFRECSAYVMQEEGFFRSADDVFMGSEPAATRYPALRIMPLCHKIDYDQLYSDGEPFSFMGEKTII
jgi:hypothetical protein